MGIVKLTVMPFLLPLETKNTSQTSHTAVAGSEDCDSRNTPPLHRADGPPQTLLSVRVCGEPVVERPQPQSPHARPKVLGTSTDAQPWFRQGRHTTATRRWSALDPKHKHAGNETFRHADSTADSTRTSRALENILRPYINMDAH
jgi:hypothetical protein